MGQRRRHQMDGRLPRREMGAELVRLAVREAARVVHQEVPVGPERRPAVEEVDEPHPLLPPGPAPPTA